MDSSLERSSSFYAGISRSGYATSTPDPIKTRYLPGNYRDPHEPDPVQLRQSVTTWFSNLIYNRQITAAGIAGAISVLLTAIFVCLVNFSIWAPFSTTKSGFWYFFTWNFIIVLVVSWAFYFAVASFMIHSIFSVNYETYLNVRRRENIIVFTMWLLSHLFWGIVLNWRMPTGFWPSSSSIGVLIFLATVLSAYRIAFESNFLLTFPDNELSKRKYILASLSFSKGSDLEAKFLRSLHIVKWAWFITLSISVLSSHYRTTFLDLFNPTFLLNAYLFVTYQLFIAYFIVVCVKIFTMEPLKLQMPSPFFAAETFLSSKPHLVHALTNDNNLFKLFGIKNLRDLAMNDPKERQEVYTLSQPGGHPRNWNSIRDVCLSIIHQISSRLEAENVTMQAGNAKFFSSLTSGLEKPNRAAILLPPSLKPRFLSQPGLPQSKPLSPIAVWLKPYIEKTKAWYFQDPPVISTYESTMTEYAIESLYLLAMQAYNEDTYGVVQRDLTNIIEKLLEFEVNMDTFIRAKNLNQADKRSVTTIQDIEIVLIEALYKLHARYQDHIDALSLPKEQLDLWELLVRE